MFAAAQPVPQYGVSASVLPEAEEAALSYRSMERSCDSGSGCHGDDQSPAAVTSETSTECVRAESTSSPSSTSSLTSPQSSVLTLPSSTLQLPKNAVELIAWAITECVSTTPTLVQIASRIHKQVAAYRDQDFGVVMRMVQHHLDNNPEYFLPVLMAPPGVSGRPPAMNKWALNRQTVHVRKDGSLSRRRPHRPSSSSSYVSKHVTSSSPYVPAPPQACPSPKFLFQCLQSEGVQQGPGTSQLQVYSGTPPPATSYLPASSAPCSSGSSTAGGAVYSFSSAHGSHTYTSSADPIISTVGIQQLCQAGVYGSTQGPATYRGGGPSYAPTVGPYRGPSYSTAVGPYGALASPNYSSVLGPLGAAYGLTSASGYASGMSLGLHPALYGGVSSGAGYEVNGTYSLTQGTTFDLSYATGPAAGATAVGVPGTGMAYQCSL